jgi:hypothetical protein
MSVVLEGLVGWGGGRCTKQLHRRSPIQEEGQTLNRPCNQTAARTRRLRHVRVDVWRGFLIYLAAGSEDGKFCSQGWCQCDAWLEAETFPDENSDFWGKLSQVSQTSALPSHDGYHQRGIFVARGMKLLVTDDKRLY